jgi:hypothetical protein
MEPISVYIGTVCIATVAFYCGYTWGVFVVAPHRRGTLITRIGRTLAQKLFDYIYRTGRKQ